jgi:hypothetical protein
MLALVTLAGVCLAIIASPVYERKRMMRWVVENGGYVDFFQKPEPLFTDCGGLVLIIDSYQRVLGPEKEPEIPNWRKWLGDVPANIIMLPAESRQSELERARSLFPEAEVDVVVEGPGNGGIF